MRFFASFGGNLSQAELDFVDVDVTTDNRLYLDPYAIQIRDDKWSADCGDHIRSFFNEVLDSLRSGNARRVEHLLGNLHEPNETFLGQSSGHPSGRGVGRGKARDFARALRNSRAFSTGLLSDISEAELFIEGVGPDTISDLTTNILRRKLAVYTKDQCDLHGIPVQEVGNIGPHWSIERNDWISSYYYLPIVRGYPVLLVPKYSVRRHLALVSQEFYNHYMLSFLQREYLDSRSALVQTFKDGTPYVTKKSVKVVHPYIKDELASFVSKHPEVLEAYKRLKGNAGPIRNRELEEEFDERAFSSALIGRLSHIRPGSEGAAEFHSISMGICTFLFYPQLIYPVKEKEIHNGRKRVDIKYTVSGEDGFFSRMLQAPQTRAVSVMIECKNYTKDVSNPEFDQLTSRFGHQRGFFGIMLCRHIEDKARTVAACRDAANDGRGYILVFDDTDVEKMLNLVEKGQRSLIGAFLQERYEEISH